MEWVLGKMSLLSVKNLSIGLIKREDEVVKEVSFDLERGEILGIIGESGSGKSLIANSIMQLNRNFTRQSGQILFENMNLLDLDNKSLCSLRGSKISIVFQDPLASLNPLNDIHKQIAEAILIHNRSATNEYVKKRTAELLCMVGMEAFCRQYNTYPHEISGGQRQRVMIAIAIANNPNILIADEPTTALDERTQLGIITLLKKLRDDHLMSIIFITHNLSLMRSFADKICVIKKGIIREYGLTKQIYENPKHKYTRSLIMLCNNTFKNDKLPEKDLVLDVKNVGFVAQKRFLFSVRKKVILKDINFTLHKRETIGIIGESGAGKSTLIRSLMGIIRPSGEMYLHNKSINSKDSNRHKEMQAVLQDPFSSLNPIMTIEDIVSEGIITHKLLPTKERIKERVIEMIKNVGLKENIIHKRPHECSGGERQRIAIARALAVEPSIVVMDECTSSLDIFNERRIIYLLLSLQEQFNLSYVMVSHNLEVVRAISHRIFLIKNGMLLDSNGLDCF